MEFHSFKPKGPKPTLEYKLLPREGCWGKQVKEGWLQRVLSLEKVGQRCVTHADCEEVCYSLIYQPLITCFLPGCQGLG